ncbi:MAG: MFS transporter [Pseudomonadota bacterium]
MALIRPEAARWWVLAAMACVLGLTVLNETVIGVALDTIRTDLSMSVVASHWVINAYLLAFTCLVAFGGRLGDMIGLSKSFYIGAAIFAAAAAASGLAQSGTWLIAALAAQGVGAAIIFPNSIATISRAFPGENRGTAFGIQVAIAACFMACGPLVGGFFTSAISWRWIFWINVPLIAAIVLVVLMANRQDPKDDGPAKKTSFDGGGFVLLVVGLSALVIALMQGQEWGWLSLPIIALAAGGAALMIAFVFLELKLKQPLIELRLLRIKTFTGGNLIFAMFQFDKMAIFVFVPLFLQQVLNRSAIEAGLGVIAAVVPTLLTSYLSGRATDRFGARRPLLIALVVNGLAVLGIAYGAYQSSYGWMVGPLILWGISLPFMATPSRKALMSAAPEDHQGEASGVNITIQMLGGTVGMALCSTVLLITGSYAITFAMTGVLLLLSFIIAWGMVEVPDRRGQAGA